jgi:hypothetical protein
VSTVPEAGPDLPATDELFTIDAWRHRWPTGAEKVELARGVPVFTGQFDHRDVETAQLCYPDRRVFLNADGGIAIQPGGTEPIRPILDIA